MPKAIQPKPGTYKGIDYRSQLEISWVKYFEKVGMRFTYVDTHEFDFLVYWYGSSFDVEVKPNNHELVMQAIGRICDFYERNPQKRFTSFVICGNPPSPYGMPTIIELFSFEARPGHHLGYGVQWGSLEKCYENGTSIIPAFNTGKPNCFSICWSRTALETVINEWIFDKYDDVLEDL